MKKAERKISLMTTEVRAECESAVENCREFLKRAWSVPKSQPKTKPSCLQSSMRDRQWIRSRFHLIFGLDVQVLRRGNVPTPIVEEGTCGQSLTGEAKPLWKHTANKLFESFQYPSGHRQQAHEAALVLSVPHKEILPSKAKMSGIAYNQIQIKPLISYFVKQSGQARNVVHVF
jgi:hypothetical protein